MRTHLCQQVNEQLIDQVVTICGWIKKRRDFGELMFLDIRDSSAILQAVIEPKQEAIFARAQELRHE